MPRALTCDLRGRDRVRYLRLKWARMHAVELLTGADQGHTDADLAGRFGLLAEDVRVVVYAARVRSTARI